MLPLWWPRVKYKTRRAELSKLQRMASLDITATIRTAPKAAIEVLLELRQCTSSWRLRPEQVFIDSTAVIKSEGFEHAYMIQVMKAPILQMGIDRTIPRHVCDKPFTVRFPDRSE
jgi:hypothetical protein